jgi:hypothetical protein
MSIYFWTEHPWIGIAIGIVFAVLGYTRDRPSAVIAALLWVAYAVFEYKMRSQCSGGRCIRIDLLLILPVLFIASIWALIAVAIKTEKS